LVLRDGRPLLRGMEHAAAYAIPGSAQRGWGLGPHRGDTPASVSQRHLLGGV